MCLVSVVRSSASVLSHSLSLSLSLSSLFLCCISSPFTFTAVMLPSAFPTGFPIYDFSSFTKAKKNTSSLPPYHEHTTATSTSLKPLPSKNCSVTTYFRSSVCFANSPILTYSCESNTPPPPPPPSLLFSSGLLPSPTHPSLRVRLKHTPKAHTLFYLSLPLSHFSHIKREKKIKRSEEKHTHTHTPTQQHNSLPPPHHTTPHHPHPSPPNALS